MIASFSSARLACLLSTAWEKSAPTLDLAFELAQRVGLCHRPTLPAAICER